MAVSSDEKWEVEKTEPIMSAKLGLPPSKQYLRYKALEQLGSRVPYPASFVGSSGKLMTMISVFEWLGLPEWDKWGKTNAMVWTQLHPVTRDPQIVVSKMIDGVEIGRPRVVSISTKSRAWFNVVLKSTPPKQRDETNRWWFEQSGKGKIFRAVCHGVTMKPGSSPFDRLLVFTVSEAEEWCRTHPKNIGKSPEQRAREKAEWLAKREERRIQREITDLVDQLSTEREQGE